MSRPMMSPATRSLPAVLAAFTIAAAGLMAAAPAHAQDAAEGAKKAAMCIGCHGIHGYQASFPEIHKVPMISGQNAAYLVAALTAYKKGERRHPTMRGIAASLSDKDMADLAAYYEKNLRSPIKTVADTPAVQPSPEVAALLAKGACASCHGANFSKPINPVYPKLAGQHADYLMVALRNYGTEGNPQVGRANPIMNAQVKPFTRAEQKAIANYLASLPGELQTVPQSKFR
jgi:cytochrome c553